MYDLDWPNRSEVDVVERTNERRFTSEIRRRNCARTK